MIVRVVWVGLGAMLGACVSNGLPRPTDAQQNRADQSIGSVPAIAQESDPTFRAGGSDLTLRQPQDYYRFVSPDDAYF